MGGMLTSWRADPHPAQKAEFWGEGTEETDKSTELSVPCLSEIY